MPREPASPLRRSPVPELAELGLRLGVALFVMAATQAWAALGPQLARAAETRYLGLLAGVVLVGIPSRWAPAAGAGVLLAIVALAAPGPLRPMVATAVLVAFWLVGNGMELLRDRASTLAAPRLLYLAVAAIAAQALLRPQRFLDLTLGAWPALVALVALPVALVALPVAVAVAAWLLAERYGLGASALAVLLAALPMPGWNVAGTLSLLGLALGSWIFEGDRPRWLRLALPAPLLVGALAWDPRAAVVALGVALATLAASVLPRWVRGPLAGAAVLLVGGVLVGAAYPWLRTEPLPKLASALALVSRPGEPLVAIPHGSVVLTAGGAPFELAPDGRAVREVLVDAHLVHAGSLPTGTPVLALRLERGSGPPREHVFHAGTDLAEWAALRPDVARLHGFQAPKPFRAELAPDGTFFGQVYRVRSTLLGDSPMTKLVLTRDPALPPEVAVVLFRVEVR